MLCFSATGAPKKLTEILYPVSVREVSKKAPDLLGSSDIALDNKKADLTVSIWEDGGVFSMKISIDVSSVNQSLLPVDNSGQLLNKVTQMSALPWIKVYWPGLGPVTLDVKCSSITRRCQGIWANFPYDNKKETVFKIEANLRGLEGRIWNLHINKYDLFAGSVAEMGLRARSFEPFRHIQDGAKAARVGVRKNFSLKRLPSIFRKYQLINIIEWTFYNSNELRETGFFKTLNPTLFLCDHGELLLQVLQGENLQTLEMNPGDAFWANQPVVLSFSSKRTGTSADSSMRLLEFSAKNP